MAIFITGDTHGDFTRFKKTIFHEQTTMTKNDYVIVCGDFGIWDNSPNERHWLDWLDAKPFTTLFVTGNHSNYELLETYSVSEWHGGQVQRIRPSILHLMRGQIYEIQGKRFFAMGGASSHDIKDGILEPDDPGFKQNYRRLKARNAEFRINHRSWWKEELPNETEYAIALDNLEQAGWSVDYIISHCCPSSIVKILGNGSYQTDPLTDFFEEIRRRCQFQFWCFGHYHDNKIVEDRFVLLYEQIVRLV
ncbi:MAG: metallophosphoesterase family protein [Oscillospiraceae bacterium]